MDGWIRRRASPLLARPASGLLDADPPWARRRSRKATAVPIRSETTDADETMISEKEMFVGYVDPRSSFGFAFVFPEDFFAMSFLDCYDIKK